MYIFLFEALPGAPSLTGLNAFFELPFTPTSHIIALRLLVGDGLVSLQPPMEWELCVGSVWGSLITAGPSSVFSLLLLQGVGVTELLVHQKLLHRHKPLDELALLVVHKVHQLQREGRAR